HRVMRLLHGLATVRDRAYRAPARVVDDRQVGGDPEADQGDGEGADPGHAPIALLSAGVRSPRPTCSTCSVPSPFLIVNVGVESAPTALASLSAVLSASSAAPVFATAAALPAFTPAAWATPSRKSWVT